jgi:hypothetical protein
MTEFSENDVDQTIVGTTGDILDDRSMNQFSIFNQDILVRHIHRVRLFVVLEHNVDSLGDTH